MEYQNKFSHPLFDRLERNLKERPAPPVPFGKPLYDPIRVVLLVVVAISFLAVGVVLLI